MVIAIGWLHSALKYEKVHFWVIASKAKIYAFRNFSEILEGARKEEKNVQIR